LFKFQERLFIIQLMKMYEIISTKKEMIFVSKSHG